MKNIELLPSKVECNRCYSVKYICMTPDGGDYITCPICEDSEIDYLDLSDKYSKKNINFTKDDLRKEYYCGSCGIIFRMGCTHAENGCTDSYYNAHMVSKWKYKNNDTVYSGMPQFDDISEWYNHINDIKILEWVCPNNGADCDGASYPKYSNPGHYGDCEYWLKKDD